MTKGSTDIVFVRKVGKCEGCSCCAAKTQTPRKSKASEFVSEYQEAYKNRPWQPVRCGLKRRDTNRYPEKPGGMSRESTYRADFCGHSATPTRNSQAASKIDSFRSGGKAKPEDKEPETTPAGNTKEKEAEEEQRQKPEVKTEEAEAAKPERKEVKCRRCQQMPPLRIVRPRVAPEFVQDYHNVGKQMISTAMADYTRHPAMPRVKPCRPPINSHFHDEPFDGKSINSTAYQPWPVQLPEKPLWCRQKDYKRPKDGMFTRSLYTVDYSDPKVVVPVLAIRPGVRPDPIKHMDLMEKFRSRGTSYRDSYKRWENVKPESGKPKRQEYSPPKESMVCESIQRSHFKGEQASMVVPRRLRSNQEVFKGNEPHNFLTTYGETYKYEDVKGCSCACRANTVSSSVCVSCKEPLGDCKNQHGGGECDEGSKIPLDRAIPKLFDDPLCPQKSIAVAED